MTMNVGKPLVQDRALTRILLGPEVIKSAKTSTRYCVSVSYVGQHAGTYVEVRLTC